MASPGAEIEATLVRTTVVSLALQALVGRLGAQLAVDLQAHGGSGAQIGGARLEGEMEAWWDVADAMGYAWAPGRHAERACR